MDQLVLAGDGGGRNSLILLDGGSAYSFQFLPPVPANLAPISTWSHDLKLVNLSDLLGYIAL